MWDGIINVYKERGYTSHDVVAKLRGILGQKKIGHTGTLDPDAEGVLPVCLGKGTKLSDMLTDKTKTYRAVLLLGVETDTQDLSGRVLEQRPVAVTAEEARSAVLSFVGEYQQIPPMYSALKINGKKLYELARDGREVERQARSVTIYEIHIHEIDFPRVTMTVRCSKGTYIRTLCHDIGKRLGCCGCMESLLRTQTGPFLLEESLTLAQIESLRDAGTLMERIIPIDRMFMEEPEIVAPPGLDKMLHNGNAFLAAMLPLEESRLLELCQEGAGRFRVYDSSRQFIGIFEYHREEGILKPQKIFLGGN